MLFFPIIAAVLQAASFTLDKVILSLRRVDFRTYTSVSFPLSFLVTLCIFLIFKPPFDINLLFGFSGFLLFISIAGSFVTNILFYRALDHDKLGEMQILDLLRALPVIIFSGLVFADERQSAILVPALVATMAVVWSHWERHHFAIARSTLPFFIWSLSIAPVSAAIAKILLQTWNPISLHLVIGGVLAVLFIFAFQKHIMAASPQAIHYLIVTNILTTTAWILFYFGYQQLGIVHTLLLFSLQPFLVYLASIFILKERPSWKRTIAFAVVLVSIGIAEWMR
ncbi:MAG: DMT family transporter [Patescibacteria group bacterium]